MGGRGEEPALQKPVPKPVLEQILWYILFFGVDGWAI